MAIAYVGSLGTAQNKTASTSFALTTTASASAGDLVCVWIAKDNAFASGNTNEVLSVTDSAGNTYTELLDYTGLAGGASTTTAAATVAVALYACKLTSALASGGTITASLRGSTTAKTMLAARFTMPGTLGAVEYSAGDLALVFTNIPASGSLTNREHLVLYLNAIEDVGVSALGTSSPSASIGTVTTSGGGSASNIGMAAAYRIFTGTSSVSGITSSSAGSNDSATGVAVIYEVPAGPTTHDTTGTLTGQIGSVSGSAVHSVPHATSGTLTGQIGSVAGSAARVGAVVTHATSGTLTGQGSTVSGSATRFRAFATSGTLTGQGSTVAGTANRFRAFATSGTLTGQIGAVSGSATRFRAHATSGTLTGPGSVVAGTAAHIALHSTSGILTGQGATLSGSAARTREHATSGVLAGAGATLSGSANRSTGAVTHSTSGTLTGQIGSIAGSATRFRAFATSGTLTGQGSAVDGAASRTGAAVSHATSGSLTGQGAQIVALASVQGGRLHGKRPRGRRVRFDDELPPIPVKAKAPAPEPLPSLDTARALLAEARAAVAAARVARREAKERAERDEAIAALSVQYEAALQRLREARDAEARIIRRLRDEDDFFFLAA